MSTTDDVINEAKLQAFELANEVLNEVYGKGFQNDIHVQAFMALFAIGFAKRLFPKEMKPWPGV